MATVSWADWRDANPDGLVPSRYTESDTRWNVLGEAVDGTLAEATLEQVAHVGTFWFAWAAFQPDTLIIPDPGPVQESDTLHRPGSATGVIDGYHVL